MGTSCKVGDAGKMGPSHINCFRRHRRDVFFRVNKRKELNKNIGSNSLQHFVQRLLVHHSDCSKSQCHRFWWGPSRTVQSRRRDNTGQNAQNMWRYRKMTTCQRNWRSPFTFELQELVDRLDRVSRKYSLPVLINVDKTKVMTSDGIACRILIQNEQLEQVDTFP